MPGLPPLPAGFCGLLANATLEIFDLINAIFASAIIRRIIGADNCHEAMATMSNCIAKSFSSFLAL